MVVLTCENHSHLRWYTKAQSVRKDENGVLRYTHARNIFFMGIQTTDGPLEHSVVEYDSGGKVVKIHHECDCDPKFLRDAPENKEQPIEGWG